MCGNAADDPSMHDEERPIKYGQIAEGNGRRFRLLDGFLEKDPNNEWRRIAERGHEGTLDHIDRGLYITYVLKLDSGRELRVEPMDVEEIE